MLGRTLFVASFSNTHAFLHICFSVIHFLAIMTEPVKVLWSFCLGLSDTEEAALVDIMVCSCKQAALGQGPPGRVHRKVSYCSLKETKTNDAKMLPQQYLLLLRINS